MQHLNLHENKNDTRFQVNLSLRGINLGSKEELYFSTFEISSHEIGIFSARELAVGTDLDLWLSMPDNGEEIHTRGRVTYTEKISSGKYKIEIDLDNAGLKPLPLVLRLVCMRNKFYY